MENGSLLAALRGESPGTENGSLGFGALCGGVVALLVIPIKGTAPGGMW